MRHCARHFVAGCWKGKDGVVVMMAGGCSVETWERCLEKSKETYPWKASAAT